MKLECESTFQDYREVHRALGTTSVSTGGFGWLLALLCAGVLTWLLFAMDADVASRLLGRYSAIRYLVGLLMIVVLAVGVVVFNVRALRHASNPRPPGRLVVIAGWVCGAVAVAAVLGVAAVTTLNDADLTASSLIVRCIVALPYLAFAIVAIWSVFHLQRARLRRIWQGMPLLHLPQTIEITDDRLITANALERAEIKARAFCRLLETQNLLAPFYSNFHFIMLPKRAFASQAELDHCREVLRRWVALRREPRGFDIGAPARPVAVAPVPLSPPPLPVAPRAERP